jgi:hypothetical protein
MAKNTEVAKAQSTSVTVAGQVPDFLAAYGAAGNESVGVEDIVIPRLGLIQSLSPEIDETDAKYIPGAKAGDFFNSLTRELYSSPVPVVFVDRRKEYVVFKKRSAGGGFRGSFPTEQDAKIYAATSDVPSDQLEIVETATNFGLILDGAGAVVGEIVIPMTSTKLKVDRQINSMIRLRGAARFASVFYLDSTKEKNDKGTFYNIRAVIGPWVSQEIALAAKRMYDAIHSGDRKVDYEEGTAAAASEDRF